MYGEPIMSHKLCCRFYMDYLNSSQQTYGIGTIIIISVLLSKLIK